MEDGFLSGGFMLKEMEIEKAWPGTGSHLEGFGLEKETLI